MDEKEFFGELEPGVNTKPSVLSVVVDACVNDLAPWYHQLPDGSWYNGYPGEPADYLTEGEVIDDMRTWMDKLQGNDVVGDKIVSLVQGNPGWQMIVARRAIKRLKQRNQDPAGSLAEVPLADGETP